MRAKLRITSFSFSPVTLICGLVLVPLVAGLLRVFGKA